uniref:Uncharacterized protein n=1 Tax=Fagus sylvatica TaxID=28930 RepID=A0A2N9H141_FAGSY
MFFVCTTNLRINHLSLSRFLTSVPHGLTSGAISRSRLSPSTVVARDLTAASAFARDSPSPHACDLTATAKLVLDLSHPLTQPRATAPLSSSLSLTPTVKFWSTGCFSFSPIFSLIWCLLGCWSAGVNCMKF